MPQKLLLVGQFSGTHVAGSLLRGSEGFGDDLITRALDVNIAYQAPKLFRQLNWHLRGKRPPNLESFNRLAMDLSNEFKPNQAISTGIAPLGAETLRTMQKLGMRTVNFLTDDPWNPAHYTKRFLAALPYYTTIFSPRHSIFEDLQKIGCQDVRYLAFGYDPQLFYPVSPTPLAAQIHASDVMFAGGGDRDRVPYFAALINAGIRVGLYGGYWHRYAQTRAQNRGIANLETMRLAIHSSKIALCLVRRANRDGHVMRTFEVPAVGACMLTEDTADHREIFGQEGESVVYFQTIPEMVEKARWLLEHPIERNRLSIAAQQRIVRGNHTYTDRLKVMLDSSLK